MQRTITSLILSGIVVAPSILGMSIASAHEPLGNNHAYVIDGSGKVVRDGSGNCVRTGSWTEEHLIPECGGPVAAAPEPAPEPSPEPQPPRIATQSLSADALFDFDKATLKPAGKAKLDDLASQMNAAPEVEVILATGYTDRIGSEAYNLRLSERRVESVKSYMVSKGVDANRIDTSAKGEADPVESCSDIGGRENRNNKALIECLQPNRRVEVEVTVQRESEQ